MSKVYNVEVPIAGVVFMEIKADSEEEARDLALSAPICMDLTCKDYTPVEYIEVQEADLYENLSKGNILYAPMNTIKVEGGDTYE